MGITAEHLVKCYGHRTVVDDLSFTLESGCVLGFIGPNGAGKTTTMRMLTGLLPATIGLETPAYDLDLVMGGPRRAEITAACNRLIAARKMQVRNRKRRQNPPASVTPLTPAYSSSSSSSSSS